MRRVKEFVKATAPLDGLEKTHIRKRQLRMKRREHVRAPLVKDAFPKHHVSPKRYAKERVCLQIPCDLRLHNHKSLFHEAYICLHFWSCWTSHIVDSYMVYAEKFFRRPARETRRKLTQSKAAGMLPTSALPLNRCTMGSQNLDDATEQRHQNGPHVATICSGRPPIRSSVKQIKQTRIEKLATHSFAQRLPWALLQLHLGSVGVIPRKLKQKETERCR
eukprot:SAG31_NODE_8591_length_1424_cov_1.512453_2_plen_219_part_00